MRKSDAVTVWKMDLDVCRACGWMCCDGPRDPGTFPQDDITEREREQEPESCLTLAALL